MDVASMLLPLWTWIVGLISCAFSALFAYFDHHKLYKKRLTAHEKAAAVDFSYEAIHGPPSVLASTDVGGKPDLKQRLLDASTQNLFVTVGTSAVSFLATTGSVSAAAVIAWSLLLLTAVFLAFCTAVDTPLAEKVHWGVRLGAWLAVPIVFCAFTWLSPEPAGTSPPAATGGVTATTSCSTLAPVLSSPMDAR